jgi:WD40 repeat protein
MTFSLDGKMVALASFSSTVWLWDMATGAALQILEGQDSVTAVAFSSDNKVLSLASRSLGSRDNTIQLWDVTTGLVRQTLEDYTYGIDAMAFSPNNKILAVASNGGIVRLWDVATGVAQQTLKGHMDCIHSIAFSPDGKVVASASRYGTVRFWDAVTGVARQPLSYYSADKLFFSKEGLYVQNSEWLEFFQRNSAGNFVSTPPPLHTPFRRENWITQGGENLLSLHPNYRVLLAFKGNAFVFRDISGQIVFLFLNSIPFKK